MLAPCSPGAHPSELRRSIGSLSLAWGAGRCLGRRSDRSSCRTADPAGLDSARARHRRQVGAPLERSAIRRLFGGGPGGGRADRHRDGVWSGSGALRAGWLWRRVLGAPRWTRRRQPGWKVDRHASRRRFLRGDRADNKGAAKRDRDSDRAAASARHRGRGLPRVAHAVAEGLPQGVRRACQTGPSRPDLSWTAGYEKTLARGLRRGALENGEPARPSELLLLLLGRSSERDDVLERLPK